MRPALMRPVPPPPADAAEGENAPEKGAEQESGYLHLLMPVRLPG